MTTSKPHAQTKTAGYRESVNYLATILASIHKIEEVPSTMIIMVSDLFNRPLEKVLTDLSSALTR